MLFRAVVSAAALASGVAGFFPYVPEYRCLELGACVDAEKRSDETPSLPAFKMVKKAPRVQLNPATRVARLAERLKRKYSREDHTLQGRANDYSIDFGNTPTQATSAALDQDGTDYSYFTVVEFGSSKTPMYLLMDTGASSTWVMGNSCTSSACLVHNTFGTANSTSLDVSTDSFSISYGSGTVSGVYATDTISFAGLDFSMTFGLANKTSNDFLNFPIDGIMGLSLVSGTNPTVMDVISDGDYLKANIFGINLSRAEDDDNDGEINFGAPDTSKYTGDLSYSDVATTSGEWAIPLGDVGADGQTAGLTGKTAYIDSGTSYIFAPPDDAKALHDLVPNSELSSDGLTWYIPCDTDIPVQFEFNSVWYNVSTADWVGGKVGSLCTSNIYPQDVIGGGNSWLCGDTFLKNVYAVFDADQKRIGFGVKPSSTTTSSSGGTTLSSTSSTGLASSTPTQSQSQTQAQSTGSNTGSTVTSSASGGPAETASSSASSASSDSSAFNGFVASSTTTGTSGTASSTVTASSSSSTKSQTSSARPTFDISTFYTFFVVLAAFALTQLS